MNKQRLIIRVMIAISLFGVVLVDEYWKELIYLFIFGACFVVDCDLYYYHKYKQNEEIK